MSSPLPIIGDVPTATPGLGFSEYAGALADAVRGGQPPQFTLGLYGAWGSGKSSLLLALRDDLRDTDSTVIPVLFDAWRYERSDFIVVPLLHAIQTSVALAGHKDLAKTLRRALRALIFSLNFSVQGVGLDGQALKENWDEGETQSLDDAFSRPFVELRQVPAALKGKRIAVLIDDLDRCSPQNVVSVLEAINLVMDVPGFIFVLALDYDVVVDAVATRYPHVSGHAFIEKIVQLPFRVPPLDVTAATFLRDLIPDWKAREPGLPQGFKDSALDISVLGLRGNPRQIKRFINSFLVIHRVVQARAIEIEYERLAALIGLQLAWPDEHRRFQDAVFLGEEEPLSVFEGEGIDPFLTRYVERFFGQTQISTGELRQLLQLTAVVATGEFQTSAPLPGPADEVREANREELREVLARSGFKQSSRSQRLYYNSEKRNWRFVIAKHILRLERRAGKRWVLADSYLLTREADVAMRAIARPDLAARSRKDLLDAS